MVASRVVEVEPDERVLKALVHMDSHAERAGFARAEDLRALTAVVLEPRIHDLRLAVPETDRFIRRRSRRRRGRGTRQLAGLTSFSIASFLGEVELEIAV